MLIIVAVAVGTQRSAYHLLFVVVLGGRGLVRQGGHFLGLPVEGLRVISSRPLRATGDWQLVTGLTGSWRT